MNFNKVKKIFFMFGIILINLSTKVYATDLVPLGPDGWFKFIQDVLYLCIFIIYAIAVGVIIKNNKLSNIKKIVLSVSISILITLLVIRYIVIM